MTDDGDDKELPASPRKLERLREEGDVWQSRDLTGFAVLACALTGIAGAGATAAQDLLAVARRAFCDGTAGAFEAGELPGFLAAAVASGAAALLPLLLIGFAAAALAARLQVGPLFAAKRMLPQLRNLNPLTNLKNRVFSGRALLELAKAVLKAVIVGAIAWSAVDGALAALLRSYRLRPEDAARLAGGAARDLATFGLAALGAMAVFDVLHQRARWQKQHRMSVKEAKDERREEEGDPRVKARLKRAREQLLRRRMLARVREQPPDVGVRNPTHLVCLLRFDPEQGGAPRLVAKGEGLLAERLLELCAELGVPTERDVPLARALFDLDLDSEIPAELYAAVTALLRWVAEEAEKRGEIAAWVGRYSTWQGRG